MKQKFIDTEPVYYSKSVRKHASCTLELESFVEGDEEKKLMKKKRSHRVQYENISETIIQII